MKIMTGKTLFILMLLLVKSNGQNLKEGEDDDFPEPEEIEVEKQTLNGCKKASPPDTNSNWMETLDNEKLISTVTIPGSHEAMALYGGPFAECQAWYLEDQLKAGIRYFDLRASGIGLIMHGPCIPWKYLSTVLSTVRTFLTQFRNEVVLLRVKLVFPMRGRVPNLVKNMIRNAKDVWVKPDIPKIGEVRGKMVFVQKNSFKLGIILSETDKKGDYKVTKVLDKVEKIKQHLKKAANQCSLKTGSVLSLSYSSGTSLGTYEVLFIAKNFGRGNQSLVEWSSSKGI